MKSPKEARANWANELRGNPRWKQGFTRLEYIDNNNEKRNCCLGVACRLFLEDGGELEIEVDDMRVTHFDRTSLFLPKKVMDYLGLINSNMGRFKNSQGMTDHLSFLNDKGVSFAEIADIIDSGQLDTLDDNASDEQEIKEPNN